MILDHKNDLHSHGKVSARSQNLILQFHHEKIVYLALRSQSELRDIFFCPLQMAFEPRPQPLVLSWLLIVLPEGRKFIKNYVGVVREGVLTQLGCF